MDLECFWGGGRHWRRMHSKSIIPDTRHDLFSPKKQILIHQTHRFSLLILPAILISPHHQGSPLPPGVPSWYVMLFLHYYTYLFPKSAGPLYDMPGSLPLQSSHSFRWSSRYRNLGWPEDISGAHCINTLWINGALETLPQGAGPWLPAITMSPLDATGCHSTRKTEDILWAKTMCCGGKLRIKGEAPQQPVMTPKICFPLWPSIIRLIVGFWLVGLQCLNLEGLNKE